MSDAKESRDAKKPFASVEEAVNWWKEKYDKQAEDLRASKALFDELVSSGNEMEGILEAQVEELTQKVNDLEAQLFNSAVNEVDKGRAEEKLNTTESEANNLREENERLLTRRKALEQRLEDVMEQNRRSEAECAILKSKYEASEEEAVILRDEVKQREEQLEELQQKLDEVQRGQQATEAEEHSANSNGSVVKDEAVKENALRLEAEKRSKELEERVKELSSTVQELRTDLKKKEAALVAARETNGSKASEGGEKAEAIRSETKEEEEGTHSNAAERRESDGGLSSLVETLEKEVRRLQEENDFLKRRNMVVPHQASRPEGERAVDIERIPSNNGELPRSPMTIRRLESQVLASLESFSRVMLNLVRDLSQAAEEVDMPEERARDEIESLRSHIQEGLEGFARAYASLLEANAKNMRRMQKKTGNIMVFARVRPPTEEEIQEGHPTVLSPLSETELGYFDQTLKMWRAFAFDRVLAENASQSEVFEEVEHMAQVATDGFNACIFAYGITGSGKTHSMEGPAHEPGINYRILDKVFSVLESLEVESKSDVNETDGSLFETPWSASLSVLEIYNEELRDLLLPPSTPHRKLDIRVTGAEAGVQIPGLTKAAVHTADEAMRVYMQGIRNRAVASTHVHEHSSRSHCILLLEVTRPAGNGQLLRGRLFLVDLAGSERIRRSAVTGDRLREAQNINKSLSALGDVLEALDKRQPHIPYRNSKLTYLLKDCFGAHSRTLMLCAVCPTSLTAEETLYTLQFASRVRRISLGPARKSVAFLNAAETSRQLRRDLAVAKAQSDALEAELHRAEKRREQLESLTEKVKKEADANLTALAENAREGERSYKDVCERLRQERQETLKLKEALHSLEERLKNEERRAAVSERDKEAAMEEQQQLKRHIVSLERALSVARSDAAYAHKANSYMAPRTVAKEGSVSAGSLMTGVHSEPAVTDRRGSNAGAEGDAGAGGVGAPVWRSVAARRKSDPQSIEATMSPERRRAALLKRIEKEEEVANRIRQHHQDEDDGSSTFVSHDTDTVGHEDEEATKAQEPGFPTSRTVLRPTVRSHDHQHDGGQVRGSEPKSSVSTSPEGSQRSLDPTSMSQQQFQPIGKMEDLTTGDDAGGDMESGSHGVPRPRSRGALSAHSVQSHRSQPTRRGSGRRRPTTALVTSSSGSLTGRTRQNRARSTPRTVTKGESAYRKPASYQFLSGRLGAPPGYMSPPATQRTQPRAKSNPRPRRVTSRIRRRGPESGQDLSTSIVGLSISRPTASSHSSSRQLGSAPSSSSSGGRRFFTERTTARGVSGSTSKTPTTTPGRSLRTAQRLVKNAWDGATTARRGVEIRRSSLEVRDSRGDSTSQSSSSRVRVRRVARKPKADGTGEQEWSL